MTHALIPLSSYKPALSGRNIGARPERGNNWCPGIDITIQFALWAEDL